jgi:hypothetical protein
MAEGSHMVVNLFQPRGVDSKLVPLLLEVDLKVLQLGLLHLLVLQNQLVLPLHHLQFSKDNVILQLQNSGPLCYISSCIIFT